MADVLEHSRFDYALVTEAAVQDALGRSTPVSGWFTLEDRGALIRIVPVSEVLRRRLLKTILGGAALLNRIAAMESRRLRFWTSRRIRLGLLISLGVL